MFTEQHLYESPRRRWVASVKFHQLNVRKNYQSIDVGSYYGVLVKPGQHEKSNVIDEEQADYAIENRKTEIKAQQKQSVFRAKVLSNFGHQCCLSDITEADLLIASHIIPWAERIQTRLDPANGLCLSYVYDKLFDEGYFSVRDDFYVTITKKAHQLSRGIQDILTSIEGKKIREPILYPVSLDYLEYHRTNKLKK